MKMIRSRRRFIKTSTCAAIGTTTLWNTLLNLKTINAASSFNSTVIGAGDYKAMVCLMLGGGIDSYNVLIPTTTDEYNIYRSVRSNLAYDNVDCNNPDSRENIRPLGGNCGNATHGVHPFMENTQRLYNDGKLAFVSNVGTLLERVEKRDLQWGADNLPIGLFSHIDQAAHWQTGVPQDRLAVGWGGKMADLLNDANIQKNISMNISLSGSNIFQTGDTSVEYALDPENGSTGIEGFGDWTDMERIRSKAVNSIIDQTYDDIFKRTYINTLKTARDGHEIFSSAFGTAHDFGNTFGMDELSVAFETVAKTISVQSQLQMNRQIFFIELGGWDHHDGLGDDFNELVEMVDAALGSFQQAMEAINMSDCVTTFTVSDFGRTLTSNGNGSDHAWGGNMMVIGGAVNGGKIYGDYPSLALEGEREIGGGVLIPGLSTDEYFAELARWFGVMNSDLSYILPNIGNFYNTASSDNPIGFMRM